MSNGWQRMVSIYRHFFDRKILYLQQDVVQDPERLFSESVLNEVSIYIWELRRGINSLKGLAWTGKTFIKVDMK